MTKVHWFTTWKSLLSGYRGQIEQVNYVVAIFPPVKKMYLYPILQIAIKDFVLLLKRTGIDVVQSPDGFFNGNSWKGRIDALQRIGQNPW